MTGSQVRAALWRTFFRPRRLLALLIITAVLTTCGYLGWERWATGELLTRGEQELAGHEYVKAREDLARYLAARPSDPHARLLAARAARRLREYDEALQHLRCCRRDGGDPEPIAVEAALIDVQRGDEGPVAELRERARQDDDLALIVLEVLIQHDIDTGRLRLAQEGLTEYLRHRPDDLQARLGRAFVWERFLSFADALEDYRKAVAAHPDSERARLKLGETLLISGTPAEALEQFQWLARRQPDRPEVQLGLAKCRRKLDEPEEAERLLDALLTEAPDNGEALLERGQLALDRDQPAAAEAWLRRSIHAMPHDRRAHYSLSRCLLILGRREEAEALDARVNQIDADLRRLGVLQQRVMERPQDAALRCEVGLLFLRNGDRREAIRWLQMALRLDPTCQEARQALAETNTASPPP
jgi:tetratricopeptide (TPR) repeat protein